ncbi:MAG: DUF2238 domain-containing protein [Microbacterium sp.]
MIDDFLRPPRTPGDYLADAVRALGLLSVVVAAVWFAPTDAGILAFALPALMIPRFVGVRAWFDIAFGLTVLVAAWSNVLDLYRTVVGWDLVVHFVCTGLIAVLTYLLLARTDVVPRPTPSGVRTRVALVITPALALAVSALWEMVEWAGYAFITDEIIVTYVDTIGDMAAGGLGGLVGGVLLASVDLLRPEG